MPPTARVHPNRMGLPLRNPFRRPDVPLSPGTEALLRGQPRLTAPDALRYRVLAAFARGERPLERAWRPSLRFAGAVAAVVAFVVVLPLVGGTFDGPSPSPAVLAASTSRLRIRVVDDPRLGIASMDEALPGDALTTADAAEGP
jgi:hypothetical protein